MQPNNSDNNSNNEYGYSNNKDSNKTYQIPDSRLSVRQRQQLWDTQWSGYPPPRMVGVSRPHPPQSMMIRHHPGMGYPNMMRGVSSPPGPGRGHPQYQSGSSRHNNRIEPISHMRKEPMVSIHQGGNNKQSIGMIQPILEQRTFVGSEVHQNAYQRYVGRIVRPNSQNEKKDNSPGQEMIDVISNKEEPIINNIMKRNIQPKKGSKKNVQSTLNKNSNSEYNNNETNNQDGVQPIHPLTWYVQQVLSNPRFCTNDVITDSVRDSEGVGQFDRMVVDPFSRLDGCHSQPSETTKNENNVEFLFASDENPALLKPGTEHLSGKIRTDLLRYFTFFCDQVIDQVLTQCAYLAFLRLKQYKSYQALERKRGRSDLYERSKKRVAQQAIIEPKDLRNCLKYYWNSPLVVKLYRSQG